MRLGKRSRLVLDLLLAAGTDILTFCTFPTSALAGRDGWSDEALERQLGRMRENGWLAIEGRGDNGDWVLRVTATGAALVNDDIRPEQAWNRPWDGQWRMVAFDLPTEARAPRRELDLWLRRRRFGHLQNSVWIAPSFPTPWTKEAAKLRLATSSISFLEGRAFGGTTDADFVESAWNFAKINQRYQDYMRFAAWTSGRSLPEWAAEESAAWRNAFEVDPFLPNPLLPKSYLGKQAYRVRQELYRNALGQRNG